MIHVRLGVDFVPKLFVEVGGHGVVSLPPFYPPGHAFSSAVFLRQNLTQPLNLGREAVDHAPFMSRPQVAVRRVGADAVLLPGSPLTVVGKDVGFIWRHRQLCPIYRRVRPCGTALSGSV